MLIRFASFCMISKLISYLGLLSFTGKELTLLYGDYKAMSLKTEVKWTREQYLGP